jgi:hypothetical protein
MGEIADGIINGDFDEQTGEYIGPGQGFPRTLQSSNSGKLHGVTNYLRKRGLTDYSNIIQAYSLEVLKVKSPSDSATAIEIQKDFGAFVGYIKSKYPKP